jgi:hypothetical protein
MFTNKGYARRRKFKLLFVPVIIILFFGVAALVQYLWNTILPVALHAGALTYWQAAGVLLLSRILFGRFHFGSRAGRHDMGGAPSQLREKWMSMNDDERAKFKEEFRERCKGRWRR